MKNALLITGIVMFLAGCAEHPGLTIAELSPTASMEDKLAACHSEAQYDTVRKKDGVKHGIAHRMGKTAETKRLERLCQEWAEGGTLDCAIEISIPATPIPATELQHRENMLKLCQSMQPQPSMTSIR
jgi:hypothetical protein